MNTSICIRGRDSGRGRHSNCWHHKRIQLDESNFNAFACGKCILHDFLDLGRFEWKDFTTSWLDSLSRIFYNQKHANAKVNGFSHRTHMHCHSAHSCMIQKHIVLNVNIEHTSFSEKHSAHENSNNNYAHIVLLVAKLCQ